jgi:hypothetical protein
MKAKSISWTLDRNKVMGFRLESAMEIAPQFCTSLAHLERRDGTQLDAETAQVQTAQCCNRQMAAQIQREFDEALNKAWASTDPDLRRFITNAIR